MCKGEHMFKWIKKVFFVFKNRQNEKNKGENNGSNVDA